MNTNQNVNQSPLDRIISRVKFRELTGISRTTEWRLAQKNLLPKQLEISGRHMGYLESSYIAWLELNAA
ncbi:helix-turn-helix transcriptional regulator [Moritella marina]|uniref:helix-turn-helix transcriptional regulator n=1 Tax=Moritella marina TaxID=90736 RepID=UPI003704664F